VDSIACPLNFLQNSRKAVLLSLLFIVAVYLLAFVSSDLTATKDLINRELDSPLRQWLNGRLGIFLNFHFCGPIAWLSVPLGLTLFFRGKNYLVPEYRFILFFVFSMSLFIGIFAYINYRYITGLLPLLLLVIPHSLRKIFPKSEARQLLWIMAIISIIHTVFYINIELFPKYSGRLHGMQAKSGISDSAFWKTISVSSLGSKVLVNNLPEFYLHCKSNTTFCWIGGNVIYNQNGVQPIRQNLSADQYKSLLDSLNCRYVFSSRRLNEYSPAFSKFLNDQAAIVIEDTQGRILFRINE